MLGTSARLLQLLLLLQGRRNWTGNDLAERLEVTERTLRRDVERLRTVGYQVHSSAGIAGGYRLAVGAALPPLLLEDDEALAVSIGLSAVAAGTVAGMEEAAVRALTKLEQVLPTRVRRRAKALYSSIVSLAAPGSTVEPRTLVVLASACRDDERLTFRYRDVTSHASDRVVEPSGLVHVGNRWYLVAWDVERKDWRTFRVDRIEPHPATGTRFTRREPPEGNLATYVSRSVSSSPYPFRARVVFRAPIEVVAERISPSAGLLETLDEARCVLHTGAHSLDTLALWIALLGVEFDVLDPPELVDHLRTLGKRMLRATDGAAVRSRAPT